jgi:hypothetical protein
LPLLIVLVSQYQDQNIWTGLTFPTPTGAGAKAAAEATRRERMQTVFILLKLVLKV